jgi:hypothetical protein
MAVNAMMVTMTPRIAPANNPRVTPPTNPASLDFVVLDIVVMDLPSRFALKNEWSPTMYESYRYIVTPAFVDTFTKSNIALDVPYTRRNASD